MHKALGSIPNTAGTLKKRKEKKERRPGIVTCTHNPRTWNLGQDDHLSPGVQDQPGQQSKSLSK
jgi:hypothetical protein